MQSKAFSMEDNIIKEFANGDNLGRNRFGGIGASVLRYPYEDIADYIAYTRAMDRIGGNGGAASWYKYDQEYKNVLAEFKKKRSITTSKEPKLSDVYMSTLQNDNQRFGLDVKQYLQTGGDNVVTSVSEKIDIFIEAFQREIINTFIDLPEVVPYETKVNGLRQKKDYGKEGEGVSASDNLTDLRTYENLLRNKARSIASSKAKSILFAGPNVGQDVADYNIEKLVKTSKGAMHPNAVRYVLYCLQSKLTEITEDITSNMKQKTDAVNIFAPNVNEPTRFGVSGAAAKGEEVCIDDVVALEKESPSIFDKIGGIGKVYDAFNKHFPAYAGALVAYRDAIMCEEALRIALEYVNRLNKEFELFYTSFANKVISLGKIKNDIVDKLKFKKGNSVTYICGERKYLDRLAVMCPEGSEGLLLPDELNADIFEGIKLNAEVARLQTFDPYGENIKTDIFEKVLIDYFRNSVRNECGEVIDLDIIKAIQAECQFKVYFDAIESKENDDDVVNYTVTDEIKDSYLKERINLGSRLASAGIGFTTFDEPREISVATFNKELLDIRSVNIKQIFESMQISPEDSDTVSKYDLRFFNALYNITPDQLSRFKAPEDEDENLGYAEDAGIYYNAYHEYIKNIGPDSTKSATISLHIDKRWDSLTEMPEISMDANYKEMVKIHSALIYGIVFGKIKTYPSSRHDAQKRIFALEDNEGDLTTLIVSNDTECDEFYEVLDALYRDRASVAKIFDMAKKEVTLDVECNKRYIETRFYKDATTFAIGDGHKDQNSLFEIPLNYYNSLPRAKLDDNELAIMVDSVIGVLSNEVSRYEQEVDRAAILTERLIAQFELLVKNFKNEKNNLQKNTLIQDNRVITMVLRKVSNKIEELGTHNFEDKIDSLRNLVKED